ncbi:hypothetical protein Y032_0030g2095 [Ancylostoma ceylanicum]|uniref:Uncharacterized protein n=1 Tax=Ancylostoma ceylanicum TaxID=53326 RepID=A0A016URG6_9BILA|nr:hypothetical protein Y032_0030g2095 [Ancylostoma ceylanicum]
MIRIDTVGIRPMRIDTYLFLSDRIGLRRTINNAIVVPLARSGVPQELVQENHLNWLSIHFRSYLNNGAMLRPSILMTANCSEARLSCTHTFWTHARWEGCKEEFLVECLIISRQPNT